MRHRGLAAHKHRLRAQRSLARLAPGRRAYMLAQEVGNTESDTSFRLAKPGKEKKKEKLDLPAMEEDT